MTPTQDFQGALEKPKGSKCLSVHEWNIYCLCNGWEEAGVLRQYIRSFVENFMICQLLFIENIAICQLLFVEIKRCDLPTIVRRKHYNLPTVVR